MKDMTEFRVGKWTVSGQSEKRSGAYYWLCKCDCGKQKWVAGHSLRSGISLSCRCSGVSRRTHGRSHSSEYRIWCGIIRRCTDPNNPAYVHYGGRGIQICDRWRMSFSDFISDVGERLSPSYSIERKDNNGNYEPGNCEWILRKYQSRNTRITRFVTVNGECQPIWYWAEKYNLTANRIRQRIDNLKWSETDAVLTPLRRDKRRQPQL